jgi:hypothetical protein
VQDLSARLDRLLASLPKSAAPNATAPAHDIGDEIDGAKIFENRAKAVEEARTTTTRTSAPVDDDVFSPAGAAAVFAKRK